MASRPDTKTDALRPVLIRGDDKRRSSPVVRPYPSCDLDPTEICAVSELFRLDRRGSAFRSRKGTYQHRGLCIRVGLAEQNRFDALGPRSDGSWEEAELRALSNAGG